MGVETVSAPSSHTTTSSRHKHQQSSTQQLQSSLISIVQTVALVLMSSVNAIADRQTRNRVYNGVKEWCIKRPWLASFVAIQLAASAIPLSIFFGFAMTVVVVCSVVAGLIAAFWIAMGAFFLFSTLAIITSFTVGIWIYLVACFYVIRYIATVTGYINSNKHNRQRIRVQMKDDQENMNKIHQSPNKQTETASVTHSESSLSTPSNVTTIQSSPSKQASANEKTKSPIPISPRKSSTEVKFRSSSSPSSEHSYGVVSNGDIPDIFEDEKNKGVDLKGVKATI